MRRRLSVACAFAMLALGLGLVSPTAHGSCAGPQLSLGDGASPASRGVPRVQPGEVVELHVADLSTGCRDTGTGGCSASEPVDTPSPATDVPVVVRQGTHSWRLGTVSGHGAALSDTLRARLPAGLAAGTATVHVGDGRLRLRVTNP